MAIYSPRGHGLSVGISVELSWKTAVEQSTSRTHGCPWGPGSPTVRWGEVLLTALQKEYSRPQAYSSALLVWRGIWIFFFLFFGLFCFWKVWKWNPSLNDKRNRLCCSSPSLCHPCPLPVPSLLPSPSLWCRLCIQTLQHSDVGNVTGPCTLDQPLPVVPTSHLQPQSAWELGVWNVYDSQQGSCLAILTVGNEEGEENLHQLVLCNKLWCFDLIWFDLGLVFFFSLSVCARSAAAEISFAFN